MHLIVCCTMDKPGTNKWYLYKASKSVAEMSDVFSELTCTFLFLVCSPESMATCPPAPCTLVPLRSRAVARLLINTLWQCCGSAGSGVSAGLGEEVKAEVGEEEQAEGSGVGAGLGEEVKVAEQSEVAEGAEVAEQHSTSRVPVA